jgi:glycosyltransferase involved in cell wall biosynthesis
MLSSAHGRPSRRAHGSTIMVVNLYVGGHHPQHLQCLLAYWAEHAPDSELHFVVSDVYRDEHPAFLQAVDATARAHHHLVASPGLLTARRGELLSSDRLHGRVVSEWAVRLGVDHVLLMYFDHVQLSLAYGLRFDWPLSISGIFFRPTFHYRALGMGEERISAARKRVTLAAALRNPHLRYLFCFDQFAVRYFRTRSRVQAVPLPEPLYDPTTGSSPRSPILEDVEPGRRRLLLFGSIDERKGIGPVLDALASLSDRDQSQLALVLAGRVGDGVVERIGRFDSESNVQVVLEDRYVDEEEIQPLVRGCDLVLLTYVHHVGSSGVLVRAARAGVPVLSSDYGLLGAQVRQKCLGATVDATSASAIRATLEVWLAEPSSIPFDHEQARAFAATNTADAFAETIFSRLLEAN